MTTSTTAYTPETQPLVGRDVFTMLDDCLPDAPAPATSESLAADGIFAMLEACVSEATPQGERRTLSDAEVETRFAQLTTGITSVLEERTPVEVTDAYVDEQIAHIERDFGTDHVPEALHRQRPSLLRRAVGTVALVGVVAPLSFLGVTAGQSAWYEWRHGGTLAQAAAAPTPPVTALSEISPETSAPQATTTTEAVTTTTEAPYVPFTANIGDRSGVLSIPRICEDGIEVYEQDEAAVTYDRANDEWHFADDAPINRRDPDPTPLGYCEGSSNLPYQGRLGRSDKASNLGDASQFQPVAVHEQNGQGGALSVYPGQEGNAVLMSHRTTYSAGFGDIGALEAGDDVTFERSDDKTFVYRVVGHEVMAAANRDAIYNWSHPDSTSTLTLYACSKQDGTPTSPNYRYVVRAVLVEVRQTATQ